MTRAARVALCLLLSLPLAVACAPGPALEPGVVQSAGEAQLHRLEVAANAYEAVRQAVRLACDGDAPKLDAAACAPLDVAGRSAESALRAALAAAADGREADVEIAALEAAVFSLTTSWARASS